MYADSITATLYLVLKRGRCHIPHVLHKGSATAGLRDFVSLVRYSAFVRFAFDCNTVKIDGYNVGIIL